MKTVIMAGGRGTRISSIAQDIPKPLIPINGKAILQYEIESLRAQGFVDFIITVSHLAEKIIDYFGDGQNFGVHIDYFIEKEPLGNAGALFKLWEDGKLEEDFLLLNADTVFDVDFNRFVEYHKRSGSIGTLFTHPNNHPYDSGLIMANGNGVVQKWLTKEDVRPRFYKNCVNAGLHILSPEILKLSNIAPETIGAGHKVDLDRDILKPLVGTGKIYAYHSPEYVRDMGTPERFYQVSADLGSGKVAARNLKNKQKAIFLDRDGTINHYVGFLRNIDDFTLIPGAAEAIRLINNSGYLAIVVTNQPVIARGEVTVKDLGEIHNKMETLLGNEGAYLDAVYYCPHHPDKGFDGEVPELKIHCDCRKPKPGMLLQAQKDYNIDLSRSWMIGDGRRDIEAGGNAGCKTVFLTGGEDNDCACTATFTSENLLEAVRRILG